MYTEVCGRNIIRAIVTPYLDTNTKFLVSVASLASLAFDNKNTDTPNSVPPRFFSDAACEGHVSLLEWYKNNVKLNFGETEKRYAHSNHDEDEAGWSNMYAIMWASAFGQIDVLEWWKKSGFLQKARTDQAMDRASHAGHIDVLNWWKRNNVSPEYTEWAMDAAHNVETLDWWKSNYQERELQYTNHAMDDASVNNDIDILEWWKNSNLEMLYTTNAMDSQDWVLEETSIEGNDQQKIQKLEWWFKSGLSMRYTHKAVDDASAQGGIEVLNWWRNKNLDVGLIFKYTTVAMDQAAENGWIECLEWWKRSGYPMKYTVAKMQALALESSDDETSMDIVLWLQNNGIL